MTRWVTIVRCPRCGSTDAGEVDGCYEFTKMRCGACGHTQLCDEYQIKDTWNVALELVAEEVGLPAAVTPDLPIPCPTCRSAPAHFTIRPSGADDHLYQELPKLFAMRRCRQCAICYYFGFSPGGMVSDDEDEVAKMHPSTSGALVVMAAGELTAQSLAALAAVDGFSFWRLEDAVTPQVDFAPIVAFFRTELAAGRSISWRLIAAAANAGAAVDAFVAPLITELAEVATRPGQHAAERAILLTDVLDAFAQRGLNVSAGLPAARAVFTSRPGLCELRSRLWSLVKSDLPAD